MAKSLSVAKATHVSDLTEAPNIPARPILLKTGGRGPKPLAEVIVDDGLLTITPELAQRILATGKFERQRPIRERHASALAEQMRRREWTQGTQVHFGRTPDGTLHLVNGQHRMRAIILADAAIQFQILVTDVANEKELIRLYRRHDRLIATRTVADALSAEDIPAQYNLRSEIARATFGAMIVIDAGFRDTRRHANPYVMRSDEARLRLAEEWWPIAAHFQDSIDAAPANPVKQRLQSGGACAVALVTLRYEPEIADIFWRGLAENDGLRRDDPRAAYLRYLYGNKTGSAMIGARAAAAAWNAVYENRSLEAIRITDAPVTILGTPFAKSKKKG